MQHPYNANPYEMLTNRVGQMPGGQGVLALQAPMPPTAQLIPGGPYGGPWGGPYGGGWPPGAPCGPPYGCFQYSPCGPQSPAFYQQEAMAAVASKGPQITLGCNTLDQGPGTPMAVGETRTISASPTTPMCLTDWRVARSSAPSFQVYSVKAARVEFGGDGESWPADVFASDSNHVSMSLPQLYPGTNISVTIKNVAAVDTPPIHFFSTFFGFPGPLCAPCL